MNNEQWIMNDGGIYWCIGYLLFIVHYSFT